MFFVSNTYIYFYLGTKLAYFFDTAKFSSNINKAKGQKNLKYRMMSHVFNDFLLLL
mgnify:CR=1 FL=1